MWAFHFLWRVYFRNVQRMNTLEDGMSGDALKQLLQAYMSQTNVNVTSDGGLVIILHALGYFVCMCAAGVRARVLCFLGIEIE
jgi:hypothetical protein